MIATVVNTTALLQTVVAAFAGSVGVTLAFSLAIFGVTRFAEMNRDQRPLAATAAGVLTLAMLAVCVAAVGLGFIVMTSK